MIDVFTRSDWAKLCSAGLTTVLDPMIFRAGDTFLRGAPADEDAGTTLWSALDKNIEALVVFFDAVMYHDKLAIFDYGATWEPDLFGQSIGLVEQCNRDEELLVPVHVDGAAYGEVRKAAVRSLRALPRPSARLAASIRSELSAFDYRWKPRLPELKLRTDEEATLASFRYGGLLFHGYADALSDRRVPLASQPEHVLHSKREAIVGASILAPEGKSGVNYDEVLRLVGRVERQLSGAIRSRSVLTPITLPYLLSKNPATPEALLRLALAERKKSPFVDLRAWRVQVLADLAEGVVRPRTRKELLRINHELERLQRSKPLVAANRASFTVDPAIVREVLTKDVLGLASRAKLDIEADLPSLRFRIGSVLPGRRFRRVLVRLALDQQQYVRLDKAVEGLWFQRQRRAVRSR